MRSWLSGGGSRCAGRRTLQQQHHHPNYHHRHYHKHSMPAVYPILLLVASLAVVIATAAAQLQQHQPLPASSGTTDVSIDVPYYSHPSCPLFRLRTEGGPSVFWLGARTYSLHHQQSVLYSFSSIRVLVE